MPFPFIESFHKIFQNQNGTGRQTSNGHIVELNVAGSWGSLCDETFGMAEANLVCKQMGHHLGAKEVNIDLNFRKHKS